MLKFGLITIFLSYFDLFYIPSPSSNFLTRIIFQSLLSNVSLREVKRIYIDGSFRMQQNSSVYWGFRHVWKCTSSMNEIILSEYVSTLFEHWWRGNISNGWFVRVNWIRRERKFSGESSTIRGDIIFLPNLYFVTTKYIKFYWNSTSLKSPSNVIYSDFTLICCYWLNIIIFSHNYWVDSPPHTAGESSEFIRRKCNWQFKSLDPEKLHSHTQILYGFYHCKLKLCKVKQNLSVCCCETPYPFIKFAKFRNYLRISSSVLSKTEGMEVIRRYIEE